VVVTSLDSPWKGPNDVTRLDVVEGVSPSQVRALPSHHLTSHHQRTLYCAGGAHHIVSKAFPVRAPEGAGGARPHGVWLPRCGLF
jgi:hypothetical protein